METEQVSLSDCTDPESTVITKMNYDLKVHLQHLFESTFYGDVFIPEKEKVRSERFLRFMYLFPVLVAFQKKQLGLLLEWESWITYLGSYDRKVLNVFQKKLLQAFQSGDSLLASINDDDHYYAQLNVWGVCDNFLEGRMSKRSSDEPKLVSTVREFVIKSMNRLSEDNAEDAEDVMRNCLPVAALYLEYLEIVMTNPKNNVSEIEELGIKMTKFIGGISTETHKS
jgi:hypothetical protein